MNTGKFTSTMEKRAEGLMRAAVIRRLSAINGIIPEDFLPDSPTGDPLMNLCISCPRKKPEGIGFGLVHINRASSVWNFLVRNKDPYKDRGFRRLEDSFRGIVSEYSSYGFDERSVVMIFHLGHYFCYTHTEAALPLEDMGEITYVKIAPFDKEFSPEEGQTAGGRVIFSLNALLHPYERQTYPEENFDSEPAEEG